MGLAAAYRRDAGGVHNGIDLRRISRLISIGPEMSRRCALIRSVAACHRHMCVRRQFRNRQRVVRFPRTLPQYQPGSHVKRNPSLKVRQRECNSAIAAIGCSKQSKQRLVLIDRQQLPVAHRPAFRREVERKNANFSKEWFGHGFGDWSILEVGPGSGLRWKDSK